MTKIPYHTLRKELSSCFQLEEGVHECSGLGLNFINLPFQSLAFHVLPQSDELQAGENSLDDFLSTPDTQISENREFVLPHVQSASCGECEQVVILLHGLNERRWDKYLPWAGRLARQLNAAVVLFPLAFHMNRSPEAWIQPRAMIKLARRRGEQYPGLVDGSFGNVAISTRLAEEPKRVVWSGLQTYLDIVSYVDQLRSGVVSGVSPTARVDILGYSVGASLGLLLAMIDEEGRFSDSRLGLFCGGPVVNHLYPVSKYMLDSHAAGAMGDLYTEYLDEELDRDNRLRDFFMRTRTGRTFRSMITYYQDGLGLRERLLREIADRVQAVVLKKDRVARAYDAIHTLKGSKGDIPIPVEVLDFPYSYIHEEPFPVHEDTGKVDKAFDKVFEQLTRIYQ
ncbi:MAG: DUF6051 family protein [Spirochaetales bacterium]|nr:DUF6051 family protein [Spirochaetales bacterium]MCF7938396.1 DUF6051 family protein [Spirochaetales bacterium]